MGPQDRLNPQSMQDAVGFAIMLRGLSDEDKAKSWPSMAESLLKTEPRLEGLIDPNTPPTNDQIDQLMGPQRNPQSPEAKAVNEDAEAEFTDFLSETSRNFKDDDDYLDDSEFFLQSTKQMDDREYQQVKQEYLDYVNNRKEGETFKDYFSGRRIKTDDKLSQNEFMESSLAGPGQGTGVKPLGTPPKVTVGGMDFKIPSGYRLIDSENPGMGIESIPGGPQDRESPEKAAKIQMMRSAKDAAGKVRGLIFDDKGKVNRKNIFNMDIPLVPGDSGVPWTDGRKLRTAMEYGIQAITRGETGAAMPPSEVENTRERFQPSVFDSDETIKLKIDMFEKFIDGSLQLIDPSGKFNHSRFNSERDKMKKTSWMERAKKLNPGVSSEFLETKWNEKVKGRK